MRFMVMVKANAESETGTEPTSEDFEEMIKFNERLGAEGRIVLAEGLTPSSEATRVWFDGDAEPRVTDGPFAETKELVAGVWILNGESLEDIVELMKQMPCTDDQVGVLEIRALDS
jgi:hypothetical protein